MRLLSRGSWRAVHLACFKRSGLSSLRRSCRYSTTYCMHLYTNCMHKQLLLCLLPAYRHLISRAAQQCCAVVLFAMSSILQSLTSASALMHDCGAVQSVDARTQKQLQCPPTPDSLNLAATATASTTAATAGAAAAAAAGTAGVNTASLDSLLHARAGTAGASSRIAARSAASRSSQTLSGTAAAGAGASGIPHMTAHAKLRRASADAVATSAAAAVAKHRRDRSAAASAKAHNSSSSLNGTAAATAAAATASATAPHAVHSSGYGASPQRPATVAATVAAAAAAPPIAAAALVQSDSVLDELRVGDKALVRGAYEPKGRCVELYAG
jgi:hypothetical protein